MQQRVIAPDWATRISAMAWTFATWGASLDGCCDTSHAGAPVPVVTDATASPDMAGAVTARCPQAAEGCGIR